VLNHRLFDPIDPRADRDRLRPTRSAQLVERRAQADNFAALSRGGRLELRHRFAPGFLCGILRCANFMDAGPQDAERAIDFGHAPVGGRLPACGGLDARAQSHDCGTQAVNGFLDLRNRSRLLALHFFDRRFCDQTQALQRPPSKPAHDRAEVHPDHHHHCDQECPSGGLALGS